MSMIDYYSGGAVLGGARGSAMQEKAAKARGITLDAYLKMSPAERKATAPASKTRKAKKAPKAKKPTKEQLIRLLNARMSLASGSKLAHRKEIKDKLKKHGINVDKLTPDEKVKLSNYMMKQLHGRGIGSDVGSLVDNIFGFGIGSDVGSLVDNVFGFGGASMGGYPMGGGIGSDVGSLVDGLFGFGGAEMGGAEMGGGKKRRKPKHHTKRGGFNIADLAPLMFL